MTSNTPILPRGWLSDLPKWTILAPLVAAMVLAAATFDLGLGGILVAVIALSLAGSVFAAVHHAEIVAHPSSCTASCCWSFLWFICLPPACPEQRGCRRSARRDEWRRECVDKCRNGKYCRSSPHRSVRPWVAAFS